MSEGLIHVGFGQYVAAAQIVAVATPASSPIRRLVREAVKERRVIDLTNGRRTKAIVATVAGLFVLSALTPETIAGRLEAGAVS